LKRITAYGLLALVALGSGLALSIYRAPATPPERASADATDVALPDYPLEDLLGKTRYLREWSGRHLLVNFWATWCAPCREEIPVLQRARERYRGHGFEVVGVAFDEREPVKAFRDELAIQYPLLLALGDSFSLLGASGNTVGGLPHSALLDSDGKVLASHTGALSQAQLDELIRANLFR
jgi:thiol-disulfide isomerase/thioredoxin